MAGVSVLPMIGLPYAQADRLAAELRSAITDGLDLGSRGQHMRANAEAIQHGVSRHEEEFGKLRRSASDLDQMDRDVMGALELLLSHYKHFAGLAERLADLA